MTSTKIQAPILARLLSQNAHWASKIEQQIPGFHDHQADVHDPEILWIGCADARVPESVVTESLPGTLAVHRNIANLVHADDSSLLSVLAFAVLNVNVKHIIVVGHTKCLGADTCLKLAKQPPHPPRTVVERWFEPLTEIARNLPPMADEEVAKRTIVEESIKQQVVNISKLEPTKQAWKLGKDVEIHGWLFETENGLLKDLAVSISKPDQI